MENLLFLGVPILKHIRVYCKTKLSHFKTVTIIILSVPFSRHFTVKTLNIGTPRLITVVVLNIKQFDFTMK